MLHLKPEELVSLNPDNPPVRKGNVAVLAAGTGLGEAMLYYDGQRHNPLASEGGHCDFAPRTDIEIELLKYLRNKFKGHVSYERILSGPGYMNVYEFLRDKGYFPESPDLRRNWRRRRFPARSSRSWDRRGPTRCAGRRTTCSARFTGPRRATWPSSASRSAASSSAAASRRRCCRTCSAAVSGRASSTRAVSRG